MPVTAVASIGPRRRLGKLTRCRGSPGDGGCRGCDCGGGTTTTSSLYEQVYNNRLCCRVGSPPAVRFSKSSGGFSTRLVVNRCGTVQAYRAVECRIARSLLDSSAVALLLAKDATPGSAITRSNPLLRLHRVAFLTTEIVSYETAGQTIAIPDQVLATKDGKTVVVRH